MQRCETRVEEGAGGCEDGGCAVGPAACGENGVAQGDTIVLGEDGVEAEGWWRLVISFIT
jgi:hypothetical protein